MTAIFQREAYQYDHAQVALPVYLEKYIDSEWELRTTIRKDTLHRCKLGLSTKKVVHLRRPKVIEVTQRQMELVLLAMNQRKAFSALSRDVILCLDDYFCIGDAHPGFNCGAVALKMFGPSDKSYEIGARQQNVKMKIRRLEYNNVLLLLKNKYYRLPVWAPFVKLIREAEERGKFERSIQW